MSAYSHKAFTFSGSLNEEQLRFYNTHGVLHFKNFIPRQTVNSFISDINDIQDDLLAKDIKKINGVPLKFGHTATGRPVIQRLAFASQYSDRLANFLQDKRLQQLFPLLGNYEGRIGASEKDGLVVNHYENSPYSSFKQLGWHTDSPRDLFLGSRIMPMLNVGLHLDDCPFENGGLRFLPGTHKQSLFSLLFKKKYFLDNNADKNEVGLDIEAGDLTIHNGNVWHRVEQSPHIGEKSRRRVMYIPIITGDYKPKQANSRTPFYHRLGQLIAPQTKWRTLEQPLNELV